MSLEPGQGYRLLLLPPTIADISILSVIKKKKKKKTLMASGILATTTEDPVEHYLSAFRFSPLFFFSLNTWRERGSFIYLRSIVQQRMPGLRGGQPPARRRRSG